MFVVTSVLPQMWCMASWGIVHKLSVCGCCAKVWFDCSQKHVGVIIIRLEQLLLL